MAPLKLRHVAAIFFKKKINAFFFKALKKINKNVRVAEPPL
jgi:hypothetical protein